MPQCDPTFAISQVFWLLTMWLIITVCLTQFAWPRFLKRQHENQAAEQKWVDAAITRRAEIAEWQTAYQQALDVAHTEGRIHVHKELARFEKDSEKRRQDFLTQHHTSVESVAHDVSDVKEALLKWKETCLKILPFSSH